MFSEGSHPLHQQMRSLDSPGETWENREGAVDAARSRREPGAADAHVAPSSMSVPPPTDRFAETAELPNVGDVVAQRYRVERFIARGGMAHVFAARHVQLGSSLALKVLDPKVFAGVRDARLRFAREARLASQLKHPSIVEVFDVGLTEAGLPFIAMELLEGRSLVRIMAERGPMPWAVARDLMLQILDALQVAHAAGTVHRDVKPDNCLVVPETLHVKLLDFGIARVMHETQVTKTGSVMGTPHYLSPEQARGAQIDVRTDVYSAGIVLYEMLTGHCPFEEGTTFEIVGAHIMEPTPPLSSRIDVTRLPSGLPELLERVLAKDPGARPADGGSFAAELRELGNAPAAAVRPRVWVGAAAAAFVLGVSAVGFAKLLAQEPPISPTSKGHRSARSRGLGVGRASQHRASGPRGPRGPEGQRHRRRRSDARRAREGSHRRLRSEVEVEVIVEPDELETNAPSEPSAVVRRRPPSRKLQVARKIRKALLRCGRFAPPGGAKVSVRATVKEMGAIRGVQVRPPYAGTALGRCVAVAVGETDVGHGSAITFDQIVLVGG